MDIDTIQSIAELLEGNSVTEFHLETEDFKIRIHRSPEIAPLPAPVSPTQTAPPSLPAPAAETEPAAPSIDEIKSQMVGTFYTQRSPESPPLVEVGSKVEADTVIGIIKAMNVANEIRAEVSGTIEEAVTENGQPVEFGQTLFKITPEA